MGIHEPCQVRKEAALSGSSHVPQGSLGRANCLSNACGTQSKEGARYPYVYSNSSALRGWVFYLCFMNIHDKSAAEAALHSLSFLMMGKDRTITV